MRLPQVWRTNSVGRHNKVMAPLWPEMLWSFVIFHTSKHSFASQVLDVFVKVLGERVNPKKEVSGRHYT